MPLTAIFLLPATTPSPLNTIQSHIPLAFQSTLLPPFTLTHHLYATTSSLLPSTTPWPPAPYLRSFLSVLSLSAPVPPTDRPSSPSQPHPQLPTPKTFLITSTPNPVPSTLPTPGPKPTISLPNVSHLESNSARKARLDADEAYQAALGAWQTRIHQATPAAVSGLSYSKTGITIPTPQAEGLIGLLGAKMGPLWSLRVTERIEGGLAVALRDGEWTLRVGEVRQNIAKAGAGAGISANRGVVLEVTWQDIEGGEDEEVDGEEEGVVRAFLERVLQGTGVRIEGLKGVFGYTQGSRDRGEDGGERQGTDWKLAELYTEVLRTR